MVSLLKSKSFTIAPLTVSMSFPGRFYSRRVTTSRFSSSCASATLPCRTPSLCMCASSTPFRGNSEKILPRTSRPGDDVPPFRSSTRSSRLWHAIFNPHHSSSFESEFRPHALPQMTQRPTTHLKNIEKASYDAAPVNQDAAEAA